MKTLKNTRLRAYMYNICIELNFDRYLAAIAITFSKFMNSLRRILTVTLFAGCTILYTACEIDKQRTPPPEYFAHIYDSVNQKYGYNENALHFLDSIFAKYPRADYN